MSSRFYTVYTKGSVPREVRERLAAAWAAALKQVRLKNKKLG